MLSLVATAALLSTQGCERKVVVVETAPATPLAEPIARTKTLETSRLADAVNAYHSEPTSENHARVKKAVAELDGEIAELEELVAKRTGGSREEAAVKLRNLQAFRTAEVARFTASQAGVPLAAPAAPDARTGAEKVEDGVDRAGRTIEKGARKAGDAINDAVR